MDWTRGHTIGHGSSATVSVALSQRSGHIFAVKSTEFSQSQFLQREQKIISTLNSPHIVTYTGYDITTENKKPMFNLMMEYVPGGTITEKIHKHGRLDEAMVAYYTRQIVQGLDYLHSCGIVHCDIKGRNILLAENGVKIADFGCAKRVCSGDDQHFATTPIGGTPAFMAPEAARGEEQNFPADIWALGCTIIEMATGGPPWPNVTTPASMLYHIAFSSELPTFPGFLSDQAKDFLSKCLTRNPKARWTAKQLLKHPFLNDSSLITKQSQELDSTSPTSILDHGIWNSMEVSGFSFEIVRTCLSNSQCQRVKTLSSNSGKPKWTWEETWITIRSNEDDEDMALCGSVAAFASDDMELESRGGGEKLKNNIVGNVSYNDSGSDSLMSSTYMDQRDVVNNLNFERHKQAINQFQFL